MAMRYRELRGEQAARRRLRRFEEGRAAGARWVVVEESGDPEGDPYRPYSRLEVAVTTGRGQLLSTAPDEDYRGVMHAVRRVRLDMDTGEVVEDPDDPGEISYPDAAAREAAAALFRSRRVAY